MKNIYFGQTGKYIEKVVKGTEELFLLAKGDKTEIMNIKIMLGYVFWIDPGETDPGENDMLLEFFYILKGKIMYETEGEPIYLTEGEYFYVKNLKETTYFKATTEVSMLYITNQPVFHLLSSEIQKLMELNKLVEDKDIYTHNHGVRVGAYSYRIGKKLQLSKEQLEMLWHSSSLHDIGKINVPDKILNKPGQLTLEEFQYIKKHPTDGANIVNNTYIQDATKAILQHHERLDGSGYPQGLKCDEICIEGKIIGVVDTYDAMTTDRLYRKGMSPIAALNIIKSLIRKYYDESVVIFLEEILQEEGIIK